MMICHDDDVNDKLCLCDCQVLPCWAGFSLFSFISLIFLISFFTTGIWKETRATGTARTRHLPSGILAPGSWRYSAVSVNQAD